MSESHTIRITHEGEQKKARNIHKILNTIRQRKSKTLKANPQLDWPLKGYKKSRIGKIYN